jgi:hypothetical protein
LVSRVGLSAEGAGEQFSVAENDGERRFNIMREGTHHLTFEFFGLFQLFDSSLISFHLIG